MNENIVTFTPTKVKYLQKLYDKAVKENKKSFYFEEREYLTAYAKYLLEYLFDIFKIKQS